MPRNHADLGGWVLEQRRKRAAGNLDAGRAARLETVDPSGGPSRAASWARHADALAAFRYDYGHALVPARFETPAGLKLGQWVVAQRRRARARKLEADRIRKLNKLGFNWSPPRRNRPLAAPRKTGRLADH